MKRLIIISLLLSLFICPAARGESELDYSLIIKARETTETMCEMAGMDGYAGLFTADKDILESMKTLAAGDFSRARSAVVATVSDDCLGFLLKVMNIAQAEDAKVFRAVKERLYDALISILNSKAGTTWLAATSALGVSDAYAPEVAFEGIAYVIFFYADGQPKTVCAFDMNGGVASVTANYLPADALDGADWSRGAKAFIKSLVGTDLPIDASGITLNRYSSEELDLTTRLAE